MSGRFFLAVLLAGLTACSAQLMAEFHMAGVTGTATFSLSGTTLTVNIALSGASLGTDSTSVQIRPIWMVYDVNDKCSSSLLGNAAAGMATLLTGGSSAEFTNVASLDSLEGQSIVLIGSSLTVCATIQKSGRYHTAVAYFQDKVFGTVHFRQNLSPASPTRIVSDLFTADGTFGSGMWKITDSVSDCSSVDGSINVFNPTNTDDNACETTSQQSCKVGDLSGKLGNVAVGNGQSEKRHGYTDTNLPLMGDNAITDKFLLIYPTSGSGSPACAQIQAYTGHTAVANFNHDGVTGTITFAQDSPLDITTTTVSLQGLQTMAGGYHVHLWPTPTKTMEDQQMCSPIYVSGHLNPYGKDPTDPMYPAADSSTDDLYETGDLSFKYGLLDGLTEISQNYTDWNLPLYGSNSIIGRSLVIHKNDVPKSRWVCSNIEPLSSHIVAVAVFKYPVIGHIMFMQEKDNPSSDTSIFSQLDFNDGRNGTQGHRWMVNSNHIQNDMLSTDVTTRCKSTEPVYNPQNLWQELSQSSNLYDSYCANNPPFACKMGDLYGKLGPLNIRNDMGTQDKAFRQFFTDMNLPLSGPHSVLGKPLVIMNTGSSAILSCAKIEMLHDPMLSAQFEMGGVGGMVSFKQNAAFGATKTTVELSLTGIGDQHSLRIHELPPMGGDHSCTDLGLVFNPLNIAQSPASPTTDDKYPIGYLTRYDIQTNWSNYNLPLKGITSIMGRSLVVVDASNDQVVACARIQPSLPDGTSQHVMASSTFTGDVNGTIHLFQTLYSDSTMSDTSIVVDLRLKNGSQSPQHNWHAHVTPVQGDSQAADGRCSSTGGHFDPYRAMANKENYEVECGPSNPLRCEVGDQAKKLAPYDLGGGRRAFTDVDLPLAGKYSVQGRAMVVHVKNKGSARLDCADIIPDTADAVPVEFTSPDTLDKRNVSVTYASAIRADPEDVVVEFISEVNGITKVHVHFLGLQRTTMRSRFMTILNSEDRHNILGAYAPYASAANFQLVSIALSLSVLTLHLIMHL